MQIVIRESDEAVGRYAADVIAQVVRRGGATIGLATGSSPMSTYAELIRLHREEGLSFADTQAFTLDEYVGLAPDHAQSYHKTIRDAIVDHIDLPLNQLNTPNGVAENLVAEAERHEASIRKVGGVDVQLLGIGNNGHIDFNEPSSSLASRTRVESLTQSTIDANARFFDNPDEVPRLCITQGLGTIMECGIALLVAQGEGKADAIAAMAEGPVSASCPASVLQFHPHAIVVVDEAAASKLKDRAYYDLAQANRERLIANGGTL